MLTEGLVILNILMWIKLFPPLSVFFLLVHVCVEGIFKLICFQLQISYRCRQLTDNSSLKNKQ